MKHLKETLQIEESRTAGTIKGKNTIKMWYDKLGPEKFMKKLMQYFDDQVQGVSLQMAKWFEENGDKKI